MGQTNPTDSRRLGRQAAIRHRSVSCSRGGESPPLGPSPSARRHCTRAGIRPRSVSPPRNGAASAPKTLRSASGSYSLLAFYSCSLLPTRRSPARCSHAERARRVAARASIKQRWPALNALAIHALSRGVHLRCTQSRLCRDCRSLRSRAALASLAQSYRWRHTLLLYHLLYFSYFFRVRTF